nr:ATP phosphoribosyltransferase regulatory subunit [uncultured Gellertiella sp.]
MPLLTLPDFAAELADALVARQTTRVDTPVIQPAEPFLDMAGEDLRRRIFMTESETGESLCLRPEFTIPVCLRHIETATGTPRRYSYLGEVFRQRRDGANEFYQAGIEDLGDAATADADARVLQDALDILDRLAAGPLTTVLGDQSVFEAVVAELGLPSGWQKRLVHAFGNRSQIDTLLKRLASPEPVTNIDPAVRALLESADDQALIAHLDRTMVETGYSTNASRSPADIARRLRQKLELAETRLDPQAIATLQRFLSLSVPLGQAPAQLQAFAGEAGLSLATALSAFGARVKALEAEGIDTGSITYRSAFGRPLDYYTGLVFEIADQGGAVLAGGGRYDRLLTLLGAESHIPAVGFALWLDRIGTARDASRGDLVRGGVA